jgi:hypothetical protein
MWSLKTISGVIPRFGRGSCRRRVIASEMAFSEAATARFLPLASPSPWKKQLYIFIGKLLHLAG